MAKIAVDVVLLPSETMMDNVIAANKELLKRFDERIVLDKESCLPHISLAMGCIDEKDAADIGEVLAAIAEQYTPGELRVIGLNIATNSSGEKVSAFVIERTKPIQSLHEEIMQRLAPHFSYDVTADMVFGSAEVGPTSLMWIKNYPEKSSFAHFLPHITIGYGQLENAAPAMKFTASRLALCRLGNHCTCRKILVSIELEA